MMSVYEIGLWLLIVGLLGIILWQRYGKRIKRYWAERKPKIKRPFKLRPKSPEDCPCCVAGVELRQVNETSLFEVSAWAESKKPGGPKKRIDTEGYACPNTECDYFLERDSQIHALVGCGVRGRTDEIQWLKCQACQTRFSSRIETPLKDLKTPPTRIELVLNFLAEGVDPSTIRRVCGHCDETLVRWLSRAGHHAGLLHDHYFHDLQLDYLQMDELYVNVRREEGKHWLWAVIDPRTKIIPSIHIGSRKTTDAMAFVHDLTMRLAPDCVPLFTTDGLRQYFWALTAHFGQWVKKKPWRKYRWLTDPRLLYAQLIKVHRGRKLKETFSRVLCGTSKAVRFKLKELGFTGTVGTSMIERWNLTFRHMIAGLARRTWSLAQEKEKLRTHVEWGRGYYHFVRIHHGLTLDRSAPRQQRYRTPAMAAGFTDHRWSPLEILRLPLRAASHV
jgi:IS1 family transposase